MTLTLTALLYLGLILGSGNPVLSGAFSKPTIKVVPSNVVTIGQQVTIFCEGSLHAKEYCLHKEGSPDCLILRTLRETEKKAKFSISRIRWNHAGQYWCSYKTPTNMLRQSDIMELVVTVSQPQDYTAENLIRMGMSVLILVLLGILLFEAQHSQRQTQHMAGRESSASFMVAESCE
ncbi:leukocyte immunoglobulin-like receptor subfamily A member 6 isoform X4 [Arvicanthis niloticus]|uniref:leukocyte immunoglobulin-like receptor subfamily A member 6 isoform X4 n=1 Tax=Arvicanthis niloticus TaxID=61156 RepID=UPI00402B4AA6